MFPEYQDKMHASSKKVCLVVPVSADSTQSRRIESYFRNLANLQTQEPVYVHALVCSLDQDLVQERNAAKRLQAAGIATTLLSERQFPKSVSLDGPNQSPHLRGADKVRNCVGRLHSEIRFDSLEFADWGGLGFRCIQAKRMIGEWEDVQLNIHAIGPSERVRHHEGKRVSGAIDFLHDYAEEYAFKTADRRFCLDAPLCSELGEIGWLDGSSTVGNTLDDYCEHFDDVPATTNRPILLTHLPLVTIGVAYHNLGNYLEETLLSIEAQTYPELEVIVIDDGSTDVHSQHVFDEMKNRFPRFAFLSQENRGIGATRNRLIELAKGEFFLPVDADNIARPTMVQQFVDALLCNPHLAAVSSYFLAFENSEDIENEKFLFSYRPTGGPHLLSAIKNVFGDGNALFRTENLRAIGGYSTDRDSSFEDWELFVKLANAGFEIDVIPDFLFYYRVRKKSFSRQTNDYNNQARVLRHFSGNENLTPNDSRMLWDAFAGLHDRIEWLENENRDLQNRLARRRYRLADAVAGCVGRIRSFFSL